MKGSPVPDKPPVLRLASTSPPPPPICNVRPANIWLVPTRRIPILGKIS